VNSKYKDKCKFFQNGISNVSEILLYNLYASVSYWSELVVCSEICYGFNWERSNYVFMTLMMLVLFLTLWFVVIISAYYYNLMFNYNYTNQNRTSSQSYSNSR
jgi:predicted nucleic acid-binding Zn ribbon protein